MAGKWAEGFESHRSSLQFIRKYATFTGSFGVQAGRIFGFSGAPRSVAAVTPSLGNADTWIIGFGFRVASQNGNVNSTNSGIYFEDGTDEQFHIEINADVAGGSTVELRVGGTLLAATPQLDFGIWHYMEIKVTINNTTGSFEIRRNGVQTNTGTNVNTALNGNTGADVMAFRYQSDLNNFLRFDDLYVCDDAGATNNDFLGPRLIEAVEVVANGSQNDWANGATSTPDINNFQQVDDIATSTPDDAGAGGVIFSDTNSDVDVFEMTDLQQITGSIDFLQVGIQAAMAAPGTRTLRAVVSDGATQGTGPNFVVDDTLYDEFITIFDENPVTSAPWDVADIDGGELGVENVS